jgi:signal transduction histidine kinase
MLGKAKALPSLASGLSARLLLLTIGFVMLAEVLIFAPSIGRFRLTYLQERLAAGHLAILALEATPEHMVSPELTMELLTHVEAFSVALTKPGVGKLMLMDMPPDHVDATYDLREANFMSLIRDAFAVLWSKPMRIIRVLGPPPKDDKVLVEVVLDETPLRQEMLAFAQRILALSLVISLFTAALVYLSLQWLMVRPMRRISDSMSSFREDPEDASRVIHPSGRSDEIGFAEHELATMQEGLRGALQQKTRLAALGIAVTKINHDLRNILATAQLVSDRLEQSDDPEVKRVTPTLMSAIDRAASLCGETLDFTREGAPKLKLSRFHLRDLAADVAGDLPGEVNGEPVWHNLLDRNTEIEADRERLYRVLSNLGQNAIQAGASRIEVSAERLDGRLRVRVTDNGPGLPPRAREHLFQPFTGSARAGGTGLGLAIARDLVRAHGGEIRLESSTAEGTSFCFELPLRQGDES